MYGKFCGFIRFIFFGVTLGAILGFAAIYLMEHDKYFRSKAKKMCKKVDDFSNDVQSKLNNVNAN